MTPEVLARYATPAPARERAFRGEWAAIEWQPEISSPQRFVVAVLVRSNSGEYAMSSIEHFERFDCIYDGAIAAERVRFVLSYAEAGLRNVAADARWEDIHLGSPQIFVRPMGYAAGHDAASTARRLLEDVAVIGAARKARETSFTPVENERARALVKDALRGIAGLDYERIVRPDAGIIYRVGEVDRVLDIDLWTADGCGDIVSAWLASKQTIELHALRAYAEIETAARQHRKPRRALFFLRPLSAKGLSRTQREAIDRFFDEDVYKFRAQDIFIETQPDAKQLAGSIYDWARPSLAA